MAVRFTRHGLQSVAPAKVLTVSGGRSKRPKPNIFNLFPGRRIQAGVVPFGAAGMIGTAARVLGAGARAAKAAYAAQKGMTIGQRLITAGRYALGGGAIAYGLSGNVPTTNTRAAATIAGSAIGGVPAFLIGAGTAAPDLISQAINAVKGKIPPGFSSVPGAITPSELQLMLRNNLPQFLGGAPQSDVNIDFPATPAPITNIQTPGLSISGGFGGGGIDPALLALLVAGVGAGGFILGRRRRKKKRKYKKRRSQ